MCDEKPREGDNGGISTHIFSAREMRDGWYGSWEFYKQVFFVPVFGGAYIDDIHLEMLFDVFRFLLDALQYLLLDSSTPLRWLYGLSYGSCC
jgi:hypothetical protein